jgi:hypothetical protein
MNQTRIKPNWSAEFGVPLTQGEISSFLGCAGADQTRATLSLADGTVIVCQAWPSEEFSIPVVLTGDAGDESPIYFRGFCRVDWPRLDRRETDR